jgi:acetylornithine/N-succinyldiaminopimelate aminotransferase
VVFSDEFGVAVGSADTAFDLPGPPPEHARLAAAPEHGHARPFCFEGDETVTMIAALMPTYSRADLAFERGEGAWLVDFEGRRFLDFGAGIATSSLGHAHPRLVAAIAGQAARVMHVSNLYRVPQAERLAARFVEASFADSVFFCNSGAEANEGMVKMVRRAMARTGRPERTRMICFEGAFHGRTLAMLSATGNPKYLDGFGTPVDGFDHVPFGNMNAVRDAITPQTAGILVEPIQGEGGVRPAPENFLRDLRAACDEWGLLLALDEVQCGMGRTGTLFAYQQSAIEPDVLSAAKGIAGGFPMGAILARESVARHLTPGSHGTTFGGNPLACAAANAVLDVLLAPGFLPGVAEHGARLRAGLEDLVREAPDVFAGVRGTGLMLGLLCVAPNTAVQAAGVAEQILTVAAGENVLRIIPPLVVTEDDITEGLARLRRAAARVRGDALARNAAA